MPSGADSSSPPIPAHTRNSHSHPSASAPLSHSIPGHQATVPHMDRQHPLGSALPTTPQHQPPECCRSTKPRQEQQDKLICIQSFPQVNPKASLSTELCCLQRTGMLSKYTVTDLGTFPVAFTTPTSLWMINATADCICCGSPLSLLLS